MFRLVIAVVLIAFCVSEAVAGPTRNECIGGSKPYYFGTTNLMCLISKTKRSAPRRSTWRFTHRWIYFDGQYFEWGIFRAGMYRYKYGRYPAGYKNCTPIRESEPAGYSNLGVQCLQKCSRSYHKQYGKYSIMPYFGNNCHHFANRMSEILCKSTSCPSWCL